MCIAQTLSVRPHAQRHDDNLGSAMVDELQDGTQTVPGPQMTRGQQTVWIIGAIGLVAAGALYYVTRLPDGHPYKSCEGIVLMDTSCKANVAARMMMGLSPVEMDLGENDETDPLDIPAEEAMPADDVATTGTAAGEASAGAAMGDADAILGRSDSSSALADPELEMGSRQAIELNEMICTQTGQNCEAAKMARRHHVERYGKF